MLILIIVIIIVIIKMCKSVIDEVIEGLPLWIKIVILTAVIMAIIRI